MESTARSRGVSRDSTRAQRMFVEPRRGAIERRLGVGIGEQVAELTIAVLTRRCRERQQVRGVDLRRLDAVRVEAGVLGELFDRGFTIELGAQALRAA